MARDPFPLLEGRGDFVGRHIRGREEDKKVIEGVGGLMAERVLIAGGAGNDGLKGFLAEFFGAALRAACEKRPER